jgi:hypothetical protein
MSIAASASRLSALTRELEAKWVQTKDYWSDQKSREFEQRFMHELFSSVNTATASALELDKMIGKLRKECE